MCTVQTPWEKAVEFHGHSCPGLAIGYRIAQIAMEKLNITRDHNEELVAIVENDSCAVDAIQVLTGCTVGKGNLILKNIGKQVYSIATRNGGRVIRISLNYKTEKNSDTKEARIEKILHGPVDEIFKVCEGYMKVPEKARSFKTLECSFCGEAVAEPKVIVRDGKFLCADCAGENYTRGW